MQVRSIDRLDLDAAWRRVLSGIRNQELVDRLPFEVTNRLVNAGYADLTSLTAEVSPGAPTVYFAPKESRTLRPFVALSPRDLLLYQALVDQVTPALLSVLPPEDVVFAYRPTDLGQSRSIENRQWSDFQKRARIGLEGRFSHILETDVAGFFLHIKPDVIIRRLLSVGADELVCSDLDDLLRHFAVDGVQGLPQGVAASSALSNLALLPLDREMQGSWDVYFRWSDDIRYLAASYSDGYAVQERIEKILYREGFSLGGGKTWIRKATTALSRMTDLQASLDAIRDEKLRTAMSDAGPYADQEEAELVAAADYEAAESFYQETIAPLRAGRWSKDRLFRTKLRFILRVLSGHRNPVALTDAAQIVYRYPDQVVAISRYLQQLAESEASAVRRTVEDLGARGGVYLSEYLRLGLAIAAGPLAADGPSPALSDLFASMATDRTANTILRRRAATTAVALSPAGATIAQQIWEEFQTMPDPELSRLYVVAGAAGHPDRDGHFSGWRGESRLLTAAIDYFAKNPLDLARV